MTGPSFHSLAERELNDAASFYEAEREGLGTAFLSQIESTLADLSEFPESGMLIGEKVHRKLVRRFPSESSTRCAETICESWRS